MHSGPDEAACGGRAQTEVRRFRTGRDGRFSVLLDRPRADGDELVVYRVQSAKGRRAYALPIVVRR